MIEAVILQLTAHSWLMVTAFRATNTPSPGSTVTRVVRQLQDTFVALKVGLRAIPANYDQIVNPTSNCTHIHN